MFAGCWGGCSLVNNIKGREVEKQTGWMQKTRSQLLRHMFQMESLLLFPPVLRQRFRAGRQFLKGKISLESKNADGKMSFNKDSVFVHVLTNEIFYQPPSPIAFKRHSAQSITRNDCHSSVDILPDPKPSPNHKTNPAMVASTICPMYQLKTLATAPFFPRRTGWFF